MSPTVARLVRAFLGANLNFSQSSAAWSCALSALKSYLDHVHLSHR